MFRKALFGLWATCVFTAVSAGSLFAATAQDVVIYASDVPAASVHGLWAPTADPTSPNATKLATAATGWSTANAPLANPSNYFDVTFNAVANTPYTIWLRLQATNNSKSSDSVWVQFSDAYANGSPVYPISSTSGLLVKLASSANGSSDYLWGWVDGAYWLTQAATVTFPTTGSHTMRVQVRYSGVQIDQMVLSPLTYYDASASCPSTCGGAPGPITNDHTIVSKPLPAPWSTQNVGSTGLAGSASVANGVFTVSGSGADIWGTSDSFRLVSQPVSGDTRIVARVSSLQNTNVYAKAGVMLRETTDPASANVLLDVKPGGGVEFMARSTDGGTTTYLAGASNAAPVWLQLARSGSTVTGSVSTDGAAWTAIGSTTTSMATSALIGLAVTSHNTAQLNTATFDNVTVGVAPGTPTAMTPASGASGVSLTPTLTWSASNATSYSVAFGTTQTPSIVASNLASSSYAPTGLTCGTTYYWQVTAQNSAGGTTSAVSSFTTTVAPPAVPTALTPANGATNVSVAPTLTWTATAGATYTVAFGTPSATQIIARGLTSASYTPTNLANNTTYAWQITASNAGGSTTGALASFTTIVAAPGTPTPLSPASGATGVATNASLAWSSTNATSYDLYFGTTNPPANVATGMTTASYTPAAMANATTYYWQVVAYDAGGSTPGPLASFTTVAAALPTPWQSQDVGAIGLAGSATDPSGTFTVSGAGADIWGTADAFQYVFQAISGDTQIVARVDSVQNTNTYAKAGLMLRETTDPAAAHVILDVKPGGGVEFMTRAADGGSTAYVAGTSNAAPVWLKLVRSGGTATGYVSADGSTWTAVGSTSTSMASSALVGLAVTSHDTTTLNTSTFDSVAVSVPPSSTPTPTPTPTPSPTGNTWTVNAGGDFQAALNSARPGDTILLQAGATFTGNFTLPANGSTSTTYVTVRTSAPDSALPPAGTRIDPSYSAQLPKIQSPNAMPALATVPGTHHYQLIGLEFLANYQGYGDVVDLGDGSSAQNSLTLVPHDFVIDRVYIHGDVTYGQKRGIGLNSASTTIENSYIAEIKANGQDSQAICGWNGPGPYTITNNYLEAAGENVLFGGSDPAIPNLVPSDITFRRNYLSKQTIWMTQTQWNVKNLFELKNAQRVVVDGNVMEYNWLAAQVGYSVLFTPRNQDGTAPWTVVQHVQFTNNVVRHVASGINILGNDNLHPSQLTNDITVRNNLFADISSATYGGAGRFVLVSGGANITIDHNTVFEDGTSAVYADSTQATGWVFTNNIVPDNSWAIMGGNASPGNGTIAMYFPQSTWLDGIFAGSNPSTYPTGNYYPSGYAAVGFVDLTGGNYRLGSASAYKNAATDGTDVGCNIDALNTAAGTKY